MNLTEAKNLQSGRHIYHAKLKNKSGRSMRFLVTSVKTWKTKPEQVLIGLKYGMYDYFKITECDLEDYVLEESEE